MHLVFGKEINVSPAFMIIMGTLNAMTCVALLFEGRMALAVCFATYAVSSIAMIWVAK